MVQASNRYLNIQIKSTDHVRVYGTHDYIHLSTDHYKTMKISRFNFEKK